MYHETTREILARNFQLPDEFALDAGIVYGSVSAVQTVERWCGYLTNVHAPRQFNHLIVGEHHSQRIGLAVVYGAPFAADFARAFQILGARMLLQLGYFGGLQPGLRRADFIVPTEAIRMDGASDTYLPGSERLFASEELSQHIARQLTENSATVHRLPQLTIAGGILSETREHIAGWSARGFGGVDLETATTFAVAQRFGLLRAAILMCSDVIVEDDSLFMHLEGESREHYLNSRTLMEETALNAVALSYLS
jgi:uridine phosphorylase